MPDIPSVSDILASTSETAIPFFQEISPIIWISIGISLALLIAGFLITVFRN